jgi:hypothetical protein
MIFKIISMVRVRSNVHSILREDHPLVDMHDLLCPSLNQLILLHGLAAMIGKVLGSIILRMINNLPLCNHHLNLLQGISLFLR